MTPLEPLLSELNTAKTELETLRAEAKQIGGEIAKEGDAHRFDADHLLELQRIADELPTRILAAEAKLLAASVRLRVAQLPDLLADERELAERAEAKRKAFERAKEEYEKVQQQFFAANSARSMFQSDLATSRRALQDKVGELRRPTAPVVRSRPHAQKAA
jgi:chromosome segregation ATPase